MTSLIDHYDSVILDADGVIYRGTEAVEFCVETLGQIRGRTPWCVLTNNAAFPPEYLADRIRNLGIEIDARDVITSPQGAAGYLHREGVPKGSQVMVVGGEGIHLALREAGYEPVRERSGDIAAVVQGFGPEVSWHELAEACYAISSGARWIATNLDASIPTVDGFAPGNGSLVAAVANTLGRRPEAATGKPEPLLFEIAASRMGSSRPLVVGDRIDTDIRGGNRAKMATLLVLTGVSQAREVADLAVAAREDRPTYLAADLRALLRDESECRISPAGGAGDPALVQVRALLDHAWNTPEAAESARERILVTLTESLGG